MSLTRAIAHNTAIQIVGKALSTVLGLIAVALMTRHLGVEQFGWYVTATGFLQFVGILIDFGFTVTISNMLAEPEFDKTELMNTTFTWRFLTALFFYLLAPIIILFFPYSTTIKISVAILSVSFFCTALNQVFIGYYRTRLQLFIVSASEVVGRLVLVVGIWLVGVTGYSFLTTTLAVTIAAIVTTLYLFWPLRTLRFSLNRVISKSLFHKLWPTALAVIFNTLYLQADRVILPLYRSQVEVGFYGAAYRVLDVVTQLEAIVMGMIMPLITYAWSRGLVDDFKKRSQLGFDLLAFLLFPIIAGLYVLATPIMEFVAGSSFAESGLILKFLSFSIFGTCFGMVFGHVILAINKQRQAVFIYATDAIFSLIGYFIFIPRYGWLGAVLVTIFSELYAGFFLTMLAVINTRIIPRLGTIFKIIAASLLMGYAVKLAQPLPLLFSIALGTALYALLAFIFGIIKKATLREVLALSQVVEEKVI